MTDDEIKALTDEQVAELMAAHGKAHPHRALLGELLVQHALAGTTPDPALLAAHINALRAEGEDHAG